MLNIHGCWALTEMTSSAMVRNARGAERRGVTTSTQKAALCRNAESLKGEQEAGAEFQAASDAGNGVPSRCCWAPTWQALSFTLAACHLRPSCQQDLGQDKPRSPRQNRHKLQTTKHPATPKLSDNLHRSPLRSSTNQSAAMTGPTKVRTSQSCTSQFHLCCRRCLSSL